MLRSKTELLMQRHLSSIHFADSETLELIETSRKFGGQILQGHLALSVILTDK